MSTLIVASSVTLDHGSLVYQDPSWVRRYRSSRVEGGILTARSLTSEPGATFGSTIELVTRHMLYAWILLYLVRAYFPIQAAV